MAAFEDFCIVCDKQCAPNSVYCSDECKHIDEERSNSPTISACSSNYNYNANMEPAVVSPLLTPQYSSSIQQTTVKSPVDLSYESPMLSGSNYHTVSDLDHNRLDLNATAESASSRNYNYFIRKTCGEHKISSVSDMLNYRRLIH